MQRADTVLKKYLTSKGIACDGNTSAVFRDWASIVGEPLATHSRVADLVNSRLVVEVDHPGWMQIVLMKKEAILRRIASAYAFPVAGDIRVKVSHAISRTETRSTDTPPTEKDTTEADHTATTETPSRSTLDAALARLYEALQDRGGEGTARDPDLPES